MQCDSCLARVMPSHIVSVLTFLWDRSDRAKLVLQPFEDVGVTDRCWATIV